MAVVTMTQDQVAAGVEMGHKLFEYAQSLGVEVYGVASAEAYGEAFPEKPQPTRFIEDARSIVVIGLPFEPGTVATVLNPELSGLRTKAADQVGTSGTQPVGASPDVAAGNGGNSRDWKGGKMHYAHEKRFKFLERFLFSLPPGDPMFFPL